MGQQTQSTFELRHYLQVLWRRKWIVIACVIIVPVIALVLSLSQAKTYAATARLMVESQAADINAATGVYSGSQTVDTRQVATLASFVATPEVAQAVKAALGWSDSTGQLTKSVTAAPSTSGNVIDVTATRPTASQAATLANEFAGQFVALRDKAQKATLETAIKTTEDQLATTKATSPNHDALETRLSQLKILEVMTGGGVSLGQAAQTPSAPASPRPKRDAALAVVAGLILGVGLAFLREALDVKIHTVEELESLTAIPILGTIDMLPRSMRGDGRIVTLEDPRNPTSEAYRRLRTNIDFMNFNRDLKSILITSPLPGQGKSTTIANLAIALLRTGKRVAVIEGDLRRPSLHTYFKVPNTLGVTSVVAGAATLDEALRVMTFREDPAVLTTSDARRSPAPSAPDGLELRLLTAGPLPPNPGEIVTSRQLSEVLDRLRDENDYVLVDAPPMLAVGDAVAMGGVVDGVIVLVKLEDTTRRMLTEIAQFLERIPARSIGLVVSGVTHSGRDSYRYSGYY
jgi:tyrosine-protein kinase